MAPKKTARKVVKTTKIVEETVEVVSIPGSQSQQNPTQIQTELISERKEEQSSITTKSIPIQESDHDDQDEEETETQDQDHPDLSTPPRKEAPPRVPEISKTAKPKAENKGGVEKKTRKRSKRGKGEGGGEGYKRYVFRVLKQVHPGMGISSRAMIVINNFMNDMFERIAEEGSRLNKQNKKMTMSAREIQGAVKLVLPGELGKHAVAEGAKAVTNYVNFGFHKK
ncbi:unnamed protein product [Amaranthus hypochondriacus]